MALCAVHQQSPHSLHTSHTSWSPDILAPGPRAQVCSNHVTLGHSYSLIKRYLHCIWSCFTVQNTTTACPPKTCYKSYQTCQSLSTHPTRKLHVT